MSDETEARVKETRVALGKAMREHGNALDAHAHDTLSPEEYAVQRARYESPAARDKAEMWAARAAA